MTDAVRTERRGRVAEITLDRPKANAIDAATSRALGAAFRALEDDPAVSVGIVTGGGDRFFSAGWDLKAAAGGEGPEANQGAGGFAGLTEAWWMTKPVIAAVNGMALGGGFELALAADMIMASDTATFAFPEATLGIVADAGGVLRLPRRLPRAVAMEMLMTGRRADAAELARWGLVNAVVPPSDLLEAARALAERVATCAPLSLRAIKEMDRATEGMGMEAAYRETREGDLPIYRGLYDSADATEGMAAFTEKRAPNWSGR